jgi:hypothetical protein
MTYTTRPINGNSATEGQPEVSFLSLPFPDGGYPQKDKSPIRSCQSTVNGIVIRRS